jgi:hypothetical protein
MTTRELISLGAELEDGLMILGSARTRLKLSGYEP